MMNKTIWFPHKAYYWSAPKTFDKKWFWPGQKVIVETATVANEPETWLDNIATFMFFPLALMDYMLNPTKEIKIYRET